MKIKVNQPIYLSLYVYLFSSLSLTFDEDVKINKSLHPSHFLWYLIVLVVSNKLDKTLMIADAGELKLI